MSRDILEAYFKKMPSVELPPEFKDSLMQRIEKEALRLKRRKLIIEYLPVISVSVLLVVLAVFGAIHLAGRDYFDSAISLFTFDSITSIFTFNFNVDLSYLVFPLFIVGIALFLLFCDHWFRRYFERKKADCN